MVFYVLLCLLLANLPFITNAPLLPAPRRRSELLAYWGWGDTAVMGLWLMSGLLAWLALGDSSSLGSSAAAVRYAPGYLGALLGVLAAVGLVLSTRCVYVQPKQGRHYVLESVAMALLAWLLSVGWGGAQALQMPLSWPLAVGLFALVWCLLAAPGVMWVYGLLAAPAPASVLSTVAVEPSAVVPSTVPSSAAPLDQKEPS